MTNTATIAPLEPDKISGEHGNYFEQIFQVPPVICGRPLLPLSIGHYRMMARFNVAFVSESECEATAGDLLKGVLICSMPVKEFEEFASQPDFAKQVSKWGRRFGFLSPRFMEWTLNHRVFLIAPIKWLYRKLWTREYDRHDFSYLVGEMKKFQNYITESTRAPEIWEEPGDGASSNAHWSQSIEVVLRGNIGWAEDEINRTPLGKALWDYFKYMENQGLVRLMSAEEASDLATPLTPEQAEEANAVSRRALAAIRGETQPDASNLTPLPATGGDHG